MGEPAGYLITFTSYGERMHGDERGTVERLREKGGGTRELGTNVPRERDERRRLVGPPLTLSEAMRTAAARAISDVCLHYGWQLHALNVRTNHVHVVVSGGAPPERMMNAFKAWATRRFRESGLVTPGTKVWTRHGSTRYLWAEPDVVAAAAYVLEGQGPDLGAFRWSPDSEYPNP